MTRATSCPCQLGKRLLFRTSRTDQSITALKIHLKETLTYQMLVMLSLYWVCSNDWKGQYWFRWVLLEDILHRAWSVLPWCKALLCIQHLLTGTTCMCCSSRSFLLRVWIHLEWWGSRRRTLHLLLLFNSILCIDLFGLALLSRRWLLAVHLCYMGSRVVNLMVGFTAARLIGEVRMLWVGIS